MIRVMGYQPFDGDLVRIIGASRAYDQQFIGKTGIVDWTSHKAMGLCIRFAEPIKDGSLFGEAFDLSLIGIVWCDDNQITLEKVVAA